MVKLSLRAIVTSWRMGADDVGCVLGGEMRAADHGPRLKLIGIAVPEWAVRGDAATAILRASDKGHVACCLCRSVFCSHACGTGTRGRSVTWARLHALGCLNAHLAGLLRLWRMFGRARANMYLDPLFTGFLAVFGLGGSDLDDVRI